MFYLIYWFIYSSKNILCNQNEWEIAETKPAVTWPDKGHITFDNYSVKYREELDNVLNNICADIAPGEKIGIVGRTGT